jgi:hypothetical protein
MIGFSPVSFLGSFAYEYSGAFDGEAAVREYGKEVPRYLRGMVYDRYRMGHWKMPDTKEWLYPTGGFVEFSVFGEQADSLSAREKLTVLPVLRTFKLALLPQGTRSFALLADSVSQTLGGTIEIPREAEERGWIAWLGPVEQNPHLAAWLDIPRKLRPVLDSLNALPKKDIPTWFAEHFTYSLQVHGLRQGEDPLLAFLRSQKGYCEYFATLATLMLRAQRITARYVTGFVAPAQVGEESFVFRRGNAHAWVEYWDWNENTWRVMDPTPPAAFPPAVRSSGFAERVRSQMAYLMHILKDGEWKETVDRVGDWTTARLNDYRTYLLFSLFIICFISYALVKRMLAMQKWKSQNKWVPFLLASEKILARQGFVRGAGETVGAFLSRLANVQGTPSPNPGALQTLKNYQKERWL